MTLGYGLREAWPYPLAVAIGDGVTATVPLLWVVMICATFARPMACLSPTLAGRVIALRAPCVTT
jgi:small-conductance mechanosensitive channel